MFAPSPAPSRMDNTIFIEKGTTIRVVKNNDQWSWIMNHDQPLSCSPRTEQGQKRSVIERQTQESIQIHLYEAYLSSVCEPSLTCVFVFVFDVVQWFSEQVFIFFRNTHTITEKWFNKYVFTWITFVIIIVIVSVDRSIMTVVFSSILIVCASLLFGLVVTLIDERGMLVSGTMWHPIGLGIKTRNKHQYRIRGWSY